MASNSGRKSGSSGRSSNRKRVVIGADETTRVRYSRDKPEVESERRKTPRQSKQDSSRGVRATPKPSAAGRRMASNKRDERERRRRALARRRGAVVVAGVLAVVAVVWGLNALWQAPLFKVREIRVTGVSRLTTQSVLASAAIPADATLPKLPKAAVLGRLLANPWIADATVHREFPGTVEIEVVEHVPVALVDAGGTEIWFVSADGHWLGRRSEEDTTPVPTIREVPGVAPVAGKTTDSEELRNALAVVTGLSPELRAQVRSVSASTVDKTALMLGENIQVFVGSAEDIGKKDELIRRILGKEKKLVYINVRVVDRPTWRGLEDGD